MDFGKLNRLVTVQARSTTQDAAGQQVSTWTTVGQLWAHVANDTGMGSIRSGLQQNMSDQLARYSFLARYANVMALGVTNGMRLTYNGLNFDIKDVILDLDRHEKAFLVCEQGGNNG